MKFDIIEQPCVPVMLLNGESCKYSIRDVFLNAQNIKTISVESHFEEYGIKRLLEAFLMDWVRPENNEVLEELYADGKFDMPSFDAYVLECNKDGNVFDLFSEDKPFYQTKIVEEWDYSAKTRKGKKVYEYDESKYVPNIYKLFYDLPSNTNHTFLLKNYDNITPDMVLLALSALSPFLPSMGGEGYCGGINDDSPYYYWVNGNNLFQELVVNAISQEEWNSYIKGQIPYVSEEHPVIWRRKEIVQKQKSFYNISLLEGLTFMGRRITVFQTDNNSIKDCNISPSSKYLTYANSAGGTEHWKDPYCAYHLEKRSFDKDDNKNVLKPPINKENCYIPYRPKKDDITWLIGHYIYDGDKELKPGILWKFGNYTALDDNIKKGLRKYGLNQLNITMYGGYNPDSKGIYKWWIKDSLHLDEDILSSNKLSKLYVSALSDIKSVNKCIKSSLVRDLNTYIYLEKAESYLDSVFVNQIKSDKDLQLEEDIKKFRNILIQFAVECYEEELSSFDFNKVVENDKNLKVDSYEIYYNELNKLYYFAKKTLGLIESKKKGED